MARLRAERVRLDRGGYTRSGRYFGTGAPLYLVTDDEGDIHEYVRAASAVEARQKVGIYKGLIEEPVAPERRPARALAQRITRAINEPLSGAAGIRRAWGLVTETRELAERIRPMTPNDRAWKIFDNDMARARQDLDEEFHRPSEASIERALLNLRAAAQLIEGAASRAPAQRDPRRRRRR